MIHVPRINTPVDLDGPESKGGLELAAWSTWMTDGSNPKPKFSAYKLASVREALIVMFGGKCGYCESAIHHVSPEDIEHYRPKGAIKLKDGTTLEDGYWWLAASWDNLLTSCIRCNRLSRVEVADMNGTITVGKGTAFPLRSENDRAAEKDGEEHEMPLLLDPTRDDPEDSIHCTVDGEAEGTLTAVEDAQHDSLRGQTSIKVLGLNRSDLVTRRMGHIKRIRLVLEDIRWLMEEADKDEGEGRERFLNRIQRKLVELDAFLHNDQEYLLLARQIVGDFMSTIRPT